MSMNGASLPHLPQNALRTWFTRLQRVHAVMARGIVFRMYTLFLCNAVFLLISRS